MQLPKFPVRPVDSHSEPDHGEGLDMDDAGKTPQMLIDELTVLRRRNSDLEAELQSVRELQEALRKTEQRLELALSGAELGLWDYNLQTGDAFISQHRAVMLGYGLDELEPHVSSWGKLVHPDDVERVTNAFNAHVNGQIPFYECEHRLRHNSGEYVWVLARGKVVEWDPNGSPSRIVGTSLDVSDRKRAEEALQRSYDNLERRIEERTAELMAANRELQRQMGERNLAEKALQESEQMLKSLLAASPVGILFTQQGKIKWANDAWMRMFGYEKEDEFIGQSTGILHPSQEEYKRVRKILYDNLRPEIVSETDTTLRKKDGSEIDVHIRINFLDPSDASKGTISAIADVSDRKRSEEELRRSEERLELALRGADLGLWDWDLTTARAVWDQRSWGLLGYKPGEVQPDLRTFKGLFHPEDWPKFAEGLNAHLEGRIPAFDVASRLRSKSGEWRWILSQGSIVAYDPDGKPLRMAGTSVDITERKLAEQERESLRAQLVQAQKMEAIGTLTGGIAHEFNNLLAVVSGYTELLLAEKNVSEAGCEDLRRIGYAAQRGAELVRGLLAFSRNSEMHLAPIDLNHEVEQVKQLLDRTLPRMIQIDLNLCDGLKTVAADSGQVRQVLMNLALNARDAMSDGGKLTIETDNVESENCPVPEAKPGDYVLLTVSDTGIGMDKDTVDRIFDPFFSAKGLAYKTGLGLAVVHGIMEQHGGYITCESQPGQGATFKAYFPVAHAGRPDAVPDKARSVRGTETILIVDDEEDVRDLASRILNRAGYRVITAEDGLQAVDVYDKERNNISLVILDLIMPKVAGKQCLEGLLQIKPDAKVLISSGHSDAGNIDEILRAGAKGFVAKPFDMAQLLKTVRQMLDGG